jgi:hypothetical protein
MENCLCGTRGIGVEGEKKIKLINVLGDFEIALQTVRKFPRFFVST